MILDLWTAQLVRFVVVLARVAGIFSVAPLFGQAKVPAQVRIIVSVAIAMLISPIVSPPDPGASPLKLIAVLAGEAAVGLAIGYVAVLIVSAAQTAGELIDYSIGFGLAGVADPVTGVHMPVVSQFLHLVMTMLFLATGAHQLLIKALVDSYGWAGPGSGLDAGAAFSPIMAIFISVFLTSLKIAAPILGILLLCDIALGLVARTTPQMNLLMVGFPLKIGVGIAAVSLGTPVIFSVMSHLLGGMYRDAAMLMTAVGR